MGPDGLATVSQLHAAGWQRRRGQDPYGVLTWRQGRRTANLWRVDETVPRQPFTPRRRAALTLAYLAHFRCARGHESEHYVHPHYGLCTNCLEHAGLLETVSPAARTRLSRDQPTGRRNPDVRRPLGPSPDGQHGNTPKGKVASDE